MLAMDVWCFSKSTIRVDLEKHQTRLHYWGNSLCNFEEAPLQFWVFLLCTKHSAFTNKEKERLQTLGLQTNFSDCYRKSYLAVIENGTVIYETSSDDKLSYSDEITGTSIPYSLVSSNYNTGSYAEIIIDNTNYARNTRGFNIVVYDPDTQMVLDSVSFDTYDPTHTVSRDNASTLQYLQEFEYFMIENKKP